MKKLIRTMPPTQFFAEPVPGSPAALVPKSGASFARGQSKQDYGTPPEFIAAVKKRFGVTGFAWDLAASLENTKAPAPSYYDETQNALVQDWTRLVGDLWLNPPFSNIAPWAAKCADASPYRNPVHPSYASSLKRRIFFLVPASVGANWWRDHVHGVAAVKLLNGRLKFDGVSGYPKDCALCVYGSDTRPGYEVWTWEDDA